MTLEGARLLELHSSVSVASVNRHMQVLVFARYIMHAWFGLVIALLMVFLKNALMCI